MSKLLLSARVLCVCVCVCVLCLSLLEVEAVERVQLAKAGRPTGERVGVRDFVPTRHGMAWSIVPGGCGGTHFPSGLVLRITVNLAHC